MTASRSVTVKLNNMTGRGLQKVDEDLSHGEWHQNPPNQVAPHSMVQWESESDGFATGTEGRARYRIVPDSDAVPLPFPDSLAIRLFWDNPFSGSNSYSMFAPPGFDISRSDGDGDNATVTFTLTGEGWIKIGTPAEELISGGDSLYAISPGGKNIWRYEDSPNQWTAIGGPGAQFVASGPNLWGLTPDHQTVMQFTGTPNQWIPVGGPASSLAAGGAQLYALNPNGQTILRYEGVAYAVSPKGEAIWRNDGASNKWTKIGGPGQQFIADGPNLWGLTPDRQQVWQFSGTPGKWTQVGGPAEQIAAYKTGGLRAVETTTRNVLKPAGAAF